MNKPNQHLLLNIYEAASGRTEEAEHDPRVVAFVNLIEQRGASKVDWYWCGRVYEERRKMKSEARQNNDERVAPDGILIPTNDYSFLLLQGWTIF